MAQVPENHPSTGADEPSTAPPPEALPPAAGGTLEPSPDLLPPQPAPHRPGARPERATVPHTRVSAAWFGIWAGVAALILLIIFVAQNTARVQVNFLWLSGRFSLAVALLVACVGGAVIAMAVAAARIIQLRRLVRRR